MITHGPWVFIGIPKSVEVNARLHDFSGSYGAVVI
jgi:hypothetical protein